MWQKNYDTSLNGVKELIAELKRIIDILQKYSQSEPIQERIDEIQQTIIALESINQDDLNEALGEDITPESDEYNEKLKELIAEAVNEALNNLTL